MVAILLKWGLNSEKQKQKQKQIDTGKRYLEVNTGRTKFKEERQKVMPKDLRMWSTCSSEVFGTQDTEYRQKFLYKILRASEDFFILKTI